MDQVFIFALDSVRSVILALGLVLVIYSFGLFLLSSVFLIWRLVRNG